MMKKVMITILLFGIHLIMVVPAKATLLHTEAEATMGSWYLPYLKFGTIVHASVNFDVSPGTPSSSLLGFTSATGTFTWNDGTLREFHVESVRTGARGYWGIYEVMFGGTGPTINGSTLTQCIIEYNIGVNPFTTNKELSDLLLSSTITNLSIRVYDGVSKTKAGYLETNVSGSVSIPEPASLVLLALGRLLIRRKG